MREQDIAHVAGLIGEAARSTMLIALLDGRARTAGELARTANISPQTASSHLSKLLEGGLITVETQGRHRYFRLANAEVAHVLEALALVAPKATEVITVKPVEDIQYARSCYDHAAGKLGVALTRGLLGKKLIKTDGSDYQLTAAGKKYFTDIGIDVEGLLAGRRRFAYPCLDWSERVHHLAGSLGASILNMMLQNRWVLRVKQTRVLHLTPQGRHKLCELFNIEL